MEQRRLCTDIVVVVSAGGVAAEAIARRVWGAGATKGRVTAPNTTMRAEVADAGSTAVVAMPWVVFGAVLSSLAIGKTRQTD